MREVNSGFLMQILNLGQLSYSVLGNSQGAAGNFKQTVTMGWKRAGRGDTVIKLFANLFSASTLLLVPGWQKPDLKILVCLAAARCLVNIAGELVSE